MTILIPCAGKATRWGEEPGQSLVPYFPADHDCDAGFEPALETEAGWKPAPQMAPASRWRPPGPAPMFMAAGKPIIEWALQGIGAWPTTAPIIVVALHSEELEEYLTTTLPGRIPGRTWRIHFANRSRGGELESVLAARNLIVEADAPLLIAASNVYVDSDIVERARVCPPECRAIVVAGRERTRTRGACWTRLGETVEVSPQGHVIAVGDEQARGDLQTAGTYYFASAREFIEIAADLQRTDARVRGELRMHSVIDVFLRRQWRVEAVVAREAWPLRSTPDVCAFEGWGGAPGGRKRRWLAVGDGDRWE